MTNYLLGRLAQTVIVLFFVSVIVFVLVRLSGDPITLMAPPEFTRQQIEDLRRAWGLHGPIHVQYVVFLKRAVRGDFGESIRYRRSAMAIVLERLPLTYLLAAVSSLLALLISIPLGVLSAIKRGGFIDLFGTVFSTLGAAMPSFWLGIMLIMLFSVRMRILPAFGADSWQSLVMPSLTLGAWMAARLALLTRSAMLEVLRQDYIRTARSKGLAEQMVITRHALRNASISLLTAFGLQLAWLLGGSVVVEQVFAWPGVGRLLTEAIAARDVLVIQAAVLLYAISFVILNLVVDISYSLLDPRIRYG